MDVPIITLALNLVMVFVISLTYETTAQKRLIYTTSIIMLMLFPDLIIGAITGYFRFSLFEEGTYSNRVRIVIAKIITYIEALLLKNYKSTKENRNVGWNLWLSSILIPVCTLAYEILFENGDSFMESKTIASITIVYTINIITFYLYDSLSESYIQRSKLSILETENKLYSKQCEIMQASTEELQAFRHDMNNQFITLSHLLASKKYEEAETQLQELSNLTRNKIIYSTSGNVIIDGLINYKLQNAQNNNIKVKTEIAVPVQLQIDTTDIVAVLGNLIDNTLSALQNVSAEKRYLTLKVVFSQKRLIIRTSNPYCGDILFNDGKIVTSRSNRELHGYGLNNIAKAVDKYKGYMEIDCSDNIFTVDIIMYI